MEEKYLELSRGVRVLREWAILAVDGHLIVLVLGQKVALSGESARPGPRSAGTMCNMRTDSDKEASHSYAKQGEAPSL